MRNYFVIFFLMFVSFSLLAETFTLVPTDDMYTDGITGGAALDQTQLAVASESEDENERIMMKFDLSGIDPDFYTAKLFLNRYFACGGGGGVTAVKIYFIDQEWDEETWNEHEHVSYIEENFVPYVFAGPIGSQDTWFEVDITDLVYFWLFAGQPNNGIVIIADDGGRHSRFRSSNYANEDYHPYLELSTETSISDNVVNKINNFNLYPNPFGAQSSSRNNSITIKYNLEEKSSVNIVVYDIQGRKVKELINENQKADSHTINWDRMDYSNQEVNSGVYLINVKVDGISNSTKKITILK